MVIEGSKYYYSCLSDDEKIIYRQIRESLFRFDTQLIIKNIQYHHLKKILYAVLYDHPTFYYVNRKKIIMIKNIFGIKLCFHYDYSKEETIHLWQIIQEKINHVKSYIRSDMQPLACQIVIHKWMQQNIKIATKPYDKSCFTIVGALVNGVCVCEGFANAYKLICDCLHIASMIVSGIAHLNDGTTQHHAWNITRINGITSHIDITWDTIFGVGAYDYFNLSDDEIAIDHDFDRELYPPCTSQSLSYFTLNQMIAHNENDLKRIIASHYDKDYFSIKLEFLWNPSYMKQCGFPQGKIRFNQARNVIVFTKDKEV